MGTAALSFNLMHAHVTPYQMYRRVIEETKLEPHPNVLPVIRVSDAPFPVCIMSPWMPDGNITQYTRVNLDADRLTLVSAHRRGDRWE